MTETTTAVAKKTTDIGSQVIQRVDALCKVGFVLPQNYNHINAIKASMLVLSDLKDRNGRPFQEVCSPQSIQKALFSMATKGLDVSKNQAYYIVRGGELCLHESYFGKVARVKRVYPNFEPAPRVIYEGDVFEYGTDEKTGRRYLIKHEQSLANLDNDFVGAYMYLPTADGGKDLYTMTKRSIVTAWSKSSNKNLTVHNEFREKMIQKTVINSGCNMIINATPDLFESQFTGTSEVEATDEHEQEVIESHYEEITEINPSEIPVEEVKVEKEEVKEEKKEEQMDF